MARRKRNSARVNLILSVGLHTLAVVVIFFFAAREGLVGKKLQMLTATIVPKEKPKEEVKPPEPRIEPPKEEPKTEQVVAPPPSTAPVAPPPSDAAPAVAPPPAEMPAFAFDEGAKVVETSTNAQVSFYKNFAEYSFRTHWTRPELDVPDDNFVAEVEVQVDSAGKVTQYALKKNSGNKAWDDSVVKAIEGTRNIGRVPPTNFPPRFLVRFDVLPATENALE